MLFFCFKKIRVNYTKNSALLKDMSSDDFARRQDDDEEEEEREQDEQPLFAPSAPTTAVFSKDERDDEDEDEHEPRENENTKKSNTTKVLSTYGGSGSGVKNHFLHVALSASVLVLAVFLCLGLVYIPAMNPMESYALKREDECFSRANSTCENYLRAEVYFWNVTNPTEFVSGLEAPKLEEVGPFVIKDGVAKKQNVTFSEDGSEVGFVETLYGKVDWGTEGAWEETEVRASFVFFFNDCLFLLRSFVDVSLLN
jgi:hypothetical protein